MLTCHLIKHVNGHLKQANQVNREIIQALVINQLIIIPSITNIHAL